MPTQMPRNGAPLPCTASVRASETPGRASKAAMQAANAPTPGSTMRSASAMTSGSSVTTISLFPSAARIRAFSAERRLPDP